MLIAVPRPDPTEGALTRRTAPEVEGGPSFGSRSATIAEGAEWTGYATASTPCGTVQAMFACGFLSFVRIEGANAIHGGAQTYFRKRMFRIC